MMLCPDCGRLCDDRGLCPVCEQRARERAIRNGPVDFGNLSIGFRFGVDGYLYIGRDHMTIWKKGNSQKTVIAYDDIKEASFCRASVHERGFLAVRKRWDFRPIATSSWSAERSEMAVVFNRWQNRQFEKLYDFFTVRININRIRNNKPPHLQRSASIYCPFCGSRDIFHPRIWAHKFYYYTDRYECSVCNAWWYFEEE